MKPRSEELAWFTLVLLTLAVFATVNGQQLYLDDDCTIDNRTPGTCRRVANCPAAQEAIRNGRQPIICSYERNQPIVCCPNQQQRPAQQNRPAQQQQRPTRRPAPTSPKPPPSGKFRGKSWDMCLEYAKSVNQTVVQPVFLHVDEELATVESQCAIVSQGLIIGGERCEPKEFPHMAALGFGEEGNIAWLCGGSLISPRFVLTAAHCLFARGRGKVRWVRLGDINLHEDDDDASPETIEIERLVQHPNYKATANYDDIALLEMKRDVKFNAFIRPACLNTGVLPTPKGGVATATGWGVVSWTNEHGSDVLMKVDLRYDTALRCNQTFQSLIRSTKKFLRGFTDNTMICAGDPEGKKDTCVGDSGGPLQVVLKHPYYCMYAVVGLTSFGSTACGESNSPAVYTRVSHYVPWIEGIVWP